MNHDTDADTGEAPDAVDRLLGRRSRVRSLPGPQPARSPAVLGPPSPTVREEPEDRISPVEISCTPRRVYLTVEIPGASKETIEVQATDRRVSVRAPRGDGPAYHLEVDLPAAVDPASAKATYRNGVLDVTLLRRRSSGGHEA